MGCGLRVLSCDPGKGDPPQERQPGSAGAVPGTTGVRNLGKLRFRSFISTAASCLTPLSLEFGKTGI